jgi:hypothetical protein
MERLHAKRNSKPGASAGEDARTTAGEDAGGTWYDVEPADYRRALDRMDS